MENNKRKSKSIIVNGELHEKFKVFCKGKNMKIGGVVEDLIQQYLSNYDVVRKLLEENKKA